MNEKATQTVDLFDNLIRWTLVAAVAFLPLIVSPVNFDAFDLPKALLLYALALTGSIGFIARSLVAGKIVIKRTPLNKPLLALTAAVTIAVIVSPRPLLSIVGEYGRYENLFTIYSYILLGFLAGQVLDNKDWRERLVTFAFTSLGIISIYGILQAVGFDILPQVARQEFGRSASTLGNPVFFGGYLAVMIPLLLSYLVAKEPLSLLPKSVIGTLMALAVAAAILSGSRGAWLAIVVGVAAVIILNRKQAARVAGSAFAILVFGVAFMLLILSLAGAQVAKSELSSLKDRIATATDFSQGSTASRIETWKSTAEMISIRPLGGYGPDQMYVWSPAFNSLKKVQVEGNTIPDRAHNIFLQAAINGGLVNMVIILWIVVLLAFTGARALSRFGEPEENEESDDSAKVYLIGTLAALIGYLGQGLTGVDVIGLTAPVWVLAGSVAAYDADRLQPLTYSIRIKRYVEAMTVVSLIASVVMIFSLKPLIADTYYLDGVSNKRLGLSDRAIASFSNAINMYPYQSKYRVDLALTLLGQGNALKNSSIVQQSLDIAEEGLKYNPDDFNLILFQAGAYRIYASLISDQAMIGQAETYYSLALNKNPYSTSPRRGLLGLYMIQEKYSEAIEEAKLILQIDPSDSEVKIRLAQAYEKVGKIGRARAIYKELLKENPNQAEIKAALSNIQ